MRPAKQESQETRTKAREEVDERWAKVGDNGKMRGELRRRRAASSLNTRAMKS
jgi:hypothetical protein